MTENECLIEAYHIIEPGAVNMRGISKALVNVIDSLAKVNEDTAWINSHPSVRLIVTQMSELVHVDNYDSFEEAFKLAGDVYRRLKHE
jgi:hypothetical protein